MDEAYGLPDFTDLRATYPDSVRDIEHSISETILRYEPRVRDVKVEFVFQDLMNLTLFFQIRAVLETDHDNVTIVLESTMDAGGKMAVRG
jgi:type VI secretion system protein